MKKIALIAAAVIGLGASSAGAASITPATLCVPGTSHGAGLDRSDVKLMGVNATSCYGIVEGNTSDTTINAIDALEFGDAEIWEAGIKDHEPGGGADGTGNFFGVDWTLSSSAGRDGTWSLSFLDTTPSKLSFTADLLVTLKAGNGFAAYFFNDFLFDSKENNGAWDVNFGHDLGHLSVYFRDGTPVQLQAVPEPATMVLLGTGLFGVGRLARRRRQ